MVIDNCCKRDLSFDYIKGFLIFTVVWGHIIGAISTADGILLNRSSDYVGLLIYSFHMPLFVLISGYFFNNNITVRFSQILKKQFRRLIIPELTMDIIGLFLVIIFWDLYSDKIFENGVFSLKKTYHYLTSEWFLWCVFFCSLFVNIIKRLFQNKYLHVICALWILMMIFYDNLPSFIFKNQQFVRQLPFYILGIFFKNYRTLVEQFKSNIIALSGIVVSIVIIISIIPYKHLEFGFLREFIYLAFAIVAYSCIKLLYGFGVLSKFFILLGKNTLGIYIFSNYMFGFIFNPFELRFCLGSLEINHIVVFLLCFPICFLFCCLNEILRKNVNLKLLFLGEQDKKVL